MNLRGRRAGHECSECGRWFFRKAMVGGVCPSCREAARAREEARSSQREGFQRLPPKHSPGETGAQCDRQAAGVCHP